MILSLALYLNIFQSVTLQPYNNTIMQNIFKADQKKSAFILFLNDLTQSSKQFQNSLSQVARSDIKQTMIYSYLTPSNPYYFSMSQIFRNKMTNPQLFILSTKNKRYYFKQNKGNLSNTQQILKFQKSFQEGKLKPTYSNQNSILYKKSQPPYLTSLQFKKKVLQSNKQTFIFMTMEETSIRCKKYQNILADLYKVMNNNTNIQLFKIDGFLNQIEGLQYIGVPTMYWISKDNKLKRVNRKVRLDVLRDYMRKETQFEWHLVQNQSHKT